MVRRRQILVIGNNDNGCTPDIEKLAYDMGSKIAKSNSVLITGGLGGVMRAACHGALSRAAERNTPSVYLVNYPNQIVQ